MCLSLAKYFQPNLDSDEISFAHLFHASTILYCIYGESVVHMAQNTVHPDETHFWEFL